MEMKISQPIFGILVVLTKNKVTKIFNEPGIKLVFLPFQCNSFGARSGNVYFCFSILVDTSPCTWHGATPFDILQVPNVSAILSAPDKILCYVEPSNIRFPILHLSVSRGGNSILAQNCLTNRESNSHR